MITILEKFEDRFPEIDDSRVGQVFKGDIRNAFNDVMRAERDELRDYDIEYRPLKFNDDSTLAMTRTFMKTVQKIEFGDKPSIRFYAGMDHGRVLEALRDELGAGVIVNEGDVLTLDIAGIQSCVDSVLPLMDRYSIHSNLRPQYVKWRESVVDLYRN